MHGSGSRMIQISCYSKESTSELIFLSGKSDIADKRVGISRWIKKNYEGLELVRLISTIYYSISRFHRYCLTLTVV